MTPERKFRCIPRILLPNAFGRKLINLARYHRIYPLLEGAGFGRVHMTETGMDDLVSVLTNGGMVCTAFLMSWPMGRFLVAFKSTTFAGCVIVSVLLTLRQ